MRKRRAAGPRDCLRPRCIERRPRCTERRPRCSGFRVPGSDHDTPAIRACHIGSATEIAHGFLEITYGHLEIAYRHIGIAYEYPPLHTSKRKIFIVNLETIGDLGQLSLLPYGKTQVRAQHGTCVTDTFVTDTSGNDVTGG